MPANIGKVTPAELAGVMQLIRAAIHEMEDQAIYQWDEFYPDMAVITGDIATGTLYAIRSDTDIQGILVLNEIQPPEYGTIAWADQTGRPLVLHRLCVHPAFQGRGLAKKLVAFAENYACSHEYSSIRLDAFVQNPVAVRLYQDLHYQSRGRVTFRKGDFFCFEKVF
jgi:ribosomal protein S18 acetylase RimI-like enzyme